MFEYMFSAIRRFTCIFFVFSDPLPQRMEDDARETVERHLRTSSLHNDMSEDEIVAAVAIAVIEVDWRVHSSVSQSDT